MDKGTAMNAELYEALRNMGIGEKEALQVAKAVPPPDTIATKIELLTKINDARAAIPDAVVKQLRVDVEKSQADIEKIRDEAKAANLENARSDERAKGDRKLFFAALGLLIALVVMAAQILLSPSP